MFLEHLVGVFPYAIEFVQTNNNSEFTNHLNSWIFNKKTLFEVTLAKLIIKHKLIKPYTPGHNGKVKRSNSKDNEEFYSSHTFYSFYNFKNQLVVRRR